MIGASLAFIKILVLPDICSNIILTNFSLNSKFFTSKPSIPKINFSLKSINKSPKCFFTYAVAIDPVPTPQSKVI